MRHKWTDFHPGSLYRSSVTNRLAALTEIGGVNSIRSFTRSWQRAAGFQEVIPQRPAFVLAPDQAPIGAAEGLQYARTDIEAGQQGTVRSSLLRQQVEASLPNESGFRSESPEPGASHSPQRQPNGGNYREREAKALENELSQAFRVGSAATSDSIFAIPPHLATPPIIGSYGSTPDYGTIRTLRHAPSNISRASLDQASILWQEQQETGVNVPDGEIPPILVKEVEQDGKIVLAVEGQSTLPQTVFNSIK